MPKDTTVDRYHAQPAEAFHRPEPLPEGFAFNDAAPPADPDFDPPPRPRKANRGSFRRGPDPRRHVFTRDECSRGFWSALAVWGVSMGRKLHASGRWPSYRRA